MGIFDFFKKTTSSHISDSEIYGIQHQIQIMKDCQELVNDSKSIEVVLRRYNMLLSTLKKLNTYSPESILQAGHSFSKPISKIYSDIVSNRTAILEQAIVRNIEHNINSVKTQSAKYKKLEDFRQNAHSLFKGSSSDILLADTLCNKYSLQINQLEASLNSDGDGLDIHPSSNTLSFFELSNIIETEKDIQKKLDACEKSYALLPQFVSDCVKMDDELPPFINCRDVGPILYMWIGNWSSAQLSIEKCITANAYYPEDGAAELRYLNTYRKVALTAISYIRENPGCLQRNIYKALGFENEDRDALKDFLKHSQQITKEKSGNTYKLYAKGAQD